jgi:hypothetical protein
LGRLVSSGCQPCRPRGVQSPNVEFDQLIAVSHQIASTLAGKRTTGLTRVLAKNRGHLLP